MNEKREYTTISIQPQLKKQPVSVNLLMDVKLQ